MERVRIVIARVRDGVVEIQQGEPFVRADDVVILGAGQADSDGFVLVGESVCRYLTDTQVDMAFMVARLGELANQVANMGEVNTFAIPSVGMAANAQMQAIGAEARALADALQEYEIR